MKVIRLKVGAYHEQLEKLGVSQRQLAPDIGITEAHLSAIVRGRKPNVSLRVALAISGALGMRIDDLFELVDAPEGQVPKSAAAGLVSNAAMVAA
jgi:DNA-binding XRE family transcriptional regulator